jgi:hypothetical protein
LYRIRTFLAAGLISIVREEPRRGRAIKVYRSVHDAYFIPLEITPFGTLEDRLMEAALEELRERIRLQAKHMALRGLSGQRLFRNALGEVWTTSAPDAALDVDAADVDGALGSRPEPHSARGSDFWSDIYLTEAEALGLQRRLWAELEAFEGRHPIAERGSGPALSAYRLNVSLVRLNRE